jgi:hypothetical protein
VTRRCVLALLLLAIPILACNLLSSPEGGSPVAPAQGATALPTGGPPPRITIESPASGSQALVNKPMTVRVHATDAAGITRVEMREAGRVVYSQPMPAPESDVTALLVYRPGNPGTVTLEVVAYRQSTASSPVAIIVEVVSSEAELKNPASLDPTLGVAAGAACTARVAINGLSLRAGPGTNYRIVTTLRVGEALSVNGRNADTSWYQVKRDSSQESGWVSAAYTTSDTDCSRAPVVTPAPS